MTQQIPADQSSTVPPEVKFNFEIDGRGYELYTHSYLGFGGEQARESLNRAITPLITPKNTLLDPCINEGFMKERLPSFERGSPYEGPDSNMLWGTGSPAAASKEAVVITGAAQRAQRGGETSCSEALRRIYPNSHAISGSTVASAACPGKGPFSFGCVPQPSWLVQTKNFMVFENFYYAASAGGVGRPRISKGASVFPVTTQLANFRRTAAYVCSRKWADLQQEYPLDGQPKEVNQKLCFVLSYGASFLVDGLGLPLSKEITIQQKVGQSEVEWALGAAYMEVAAMLKKSNLRGRSPRETSK